MCPYYEVCEPGKQPVCSQIWRNSLKDLRGKQLAKNSGSKVKQIYN